MKLVLAIILIYTARHQSYGQETDDRQNQLILTKEFMRRVFDMQPFDSIAKCTTLSMDLPLARFKYSAAYFSILHLQLQVVHKNYYCSDLSYVPYLALSPAQRTLFEDKATIDGSRSNRDLSAIYAVYNKKSELITFVEIKDSKVSAINSFYNQGGTQYLHQFTMKEVDEDSTITRLRSANPVIQKKSTSKNDALSLARNFIKYTRDSLIYSSDPKDQRKSMNRFFKFRQNLVCSDTLDFYTIAYSAEYLAGELRGIPEEEIELLPYSKLPRRQKQSLDTGKENPDGVFAVMHGRDVITYLCFSGEKIKYFLAFRNLKSQYVFIPYGYASPQIRKFE